MILSAWEWIIWLPCMSNYCFSRFIRPGCERFTPSLGNVNRSVQISHHQSIGRWMNSNPMLLTFYNFATFLQMIIWRILLSCRGDRVGFRKVWHPVKRWCSGLGFLEPVALWVSYRLDQRLVLGGTLVRNKSENESLTLCAPMPKGIIGYLWIRYQLGRSFLTMTSLNVKEGS